MQNNTQRSRNRFILKRAPVLFACLALAAACCPTAHAQLVINPTFDSSITSGSNGNAATIEASIDQAISRIEADIATPVTVNIEFQNTSASLGTSSSAYNPLSYSQYLADLQANTHKSANDIIALASLPAGPNNPANGTANVDINLPLLRAIGEASLGNNHGGVDGIVGVDLAMTNISRTGTHDPSLFDLQAVVGHEIDEVLGIGGRGSSLPTTNGDISPLDLFRYSAPNTRSFTVSTTAVSYFSINSGTTNLVYFNQSASGDYGDWGDGVTPAEIHGNTPPQLQDAFSTAGVDINVGTNELIALDVEGYQMTTIPEPRSVALLAVGGIALCVHRKRRRGKVISKQAWQSIPDSS